MNPSWLCVLYLSERIERDISKRYGLPAWIDSSTVVSSPRILSLMTLDGRLSQ